MAVMQRISPCLWFDDQAEEAARFYVGIFPNSSITRISRYGEAGYEIHGKPAGTVLTVACETQAEVDHYWAKLSEGGDERAQQCGWLKDRYGVSWQIVPTVVEKMLGDGGSEGSERAMAAMLRMKKIDIGEMERAYAG